MINFCFEANAHTNYIFKYLNQQKLSPNHFSYHLTNPHPLFKCIIRKNSVSNLALSQIGE